MRVMTRYMGQCPPSEACSKDASQRHFQLFAIAEPQLQSSCGELPVSCPCRTLLWAMSAASMCKASRQPHSPGAPTSPRSAPTLNIETQMSAGEAAQSVAEQVVLQRIRAFQAATQQIDIVASTGTGALCTTRLPTCKGR